LRGFLLSSLLNRFRATRKHGKLLFGVSAPRGSMGNCFLALDTLYLRWKIVFWC